MKLTVTVEMDEGYTELSRTGPSSALARSLRECVLRLAEDHPSEQMARLADAVARVAT